MRPTASNGKKASFPLNNAWRMLPGWPHSPAVVRLLQTRSKVRTCALCALASSSRAGDRLVPAQIWCSPCGKQSSSILGCPQDTSSACCISCQFSAGEPFTCRYIIASCLRHPSSSSSIEGMSARRAQHILECLMKRPAKRQSWNRDGPCSCVAIPMQLPHRKDPKNCPSLMRARSGFPSGPSAIVQSFAMSLA